MSLIDTEILKIKEEIPKLNNLSDDLVFGAVCYKYFYNNGRYDIIEHKESFTDGPNDGGIDLIAVNETDLSKSLTLIQSKNIDTIHCKDDIKAIFIKMAQTVRDFNNERTSSYNAKLKRIYREKYDYTSDDQNFSIELVLFIGRNISSDFKTKINNRLKRTDDLNDFDIKIYYKNEIEQQIKSINDGQRFVPNGQIDFYKNHGLIEYNNNGILVDIKALSLRKLFDKYKDQGLFEQNFRYFVQNKKIDGQIQNSLNKKRDQFWFLNNGIIIGCEDFYIDGTNIKLKNFSIINGCQTTTIIGEYKGENEHLDFAIPCKIVKPVNNKKSTTSDGYDYFIAEIAEASNSQKPISDRDLKSNDKEQIHLKTFLQQDNPKIYLEIKRGEKKAYPRDTEAWQKIKNDKFGQLILSFILQQPGTARSGKRKIFADKAIYNSIFKKRNANEDFKRCVIDLLKLSNYYDCFIKQQGENLNEIPLNVAKNGKLCILAIIGYILKNERGLITKSHINNYKELASDIKRDNLAGSLFDPNRPDDFELSLYSIFNQLIQAVASLYKIRIDQESSVTNFLKTDIKYYSIILNHINNNLILDEYEHNNFLKKFKNVFLF